MPRIDANSAEQRDMVGVGIDAVLAGTKNFLHNAALVIFRNDLSGQ